MTPAEAKPVTPKAGARHKDKADSAAEGATVKIECGLLPTIT